MLKCPNKNCCQEFSKGDIGDNWKEFQSGYCPKCGNQAEGGWGINVDDYRTVKAAAPEPEVVDTEEIDWASCTVSQLKEALEILGLSTKGKKSVLVERLETN